MKTSRRTLKWLRVGGWSLAAVGGAALISGCTSTAPQSGPTGAPGKGTLLGPRQIVPPPYTEPALRPAEAVSPVVPAEPVIPVAEPVVAPPFESPTDVAAPAKPAPLPAPVESKLLTHKVERGESLWKVASMYGVSQQELAALNKMKLSDTLDVGRVLRVPQGGHLIPASKRTAPKSPAKARPTVAKASTAKSAAGRAALPADGTYTVQDGDSLWLVAHQFGLKSDDIRKANGLKTDVLQVGQTLVLTASAAPVAPDLPPPAVGGTGATLGAPGTELLPPPATGLGPEGVAPIGPAPAPLTGADAGVGAATLPPPGGETTVAPPPAGGAAGTTTDAALPKTLEHQVTAGDTLQTIADMYEVQVEDIKRANPQVKTDADLTPNMTIIIPYR